MATTQPSHSRKHKAQANKCYKTMTNDDAFYLSLPTLVDKGSPDHTNIIFYKNQNKLHETFK